MICHHFIGTLVYKLIACALVITLTATSSIPLVQRIAVAAHPASSVIASTAALPASQQIGKSAIAHRHTSHTLTLSPPPPLSVSRIQSAHTPGTAISNTLVVTFTVTNNRPPATMPELAEGATLSETAAALVSFDPTADPNTIHNVLLVDTFIAAVTAPGADHKGSEYTWNLGAIAPMKSLTVTLRLAAPASVAAETALDTGATAWGTLAGEMVSARARPVTLLPDGFECLEATVEANPADEYVLKRAGQLGQDAVQMFKYVRSLGYEAYYGSLRGARGTEWSQAGNSLDKASLLVALLRGSGVPACYRHGTLDDARARELVRAMFPTTGAVVGYVPEDVEKSDPLNDPTLLAEARDHWWVEAYINGSWTALDPAFSYAGVGQTFATPEGDRLVGPPDEMRHKVTVTIEVEKYDMLSYLLSGFSYQTPLSYTFTTAELVGNPLTLEHLVAHESQAGLHYGWTYYTYIPYLRLGDHTTVVMGHPFWEVLSNYPFGQFAVVSEYVHFDVTDAQGRTTRYTRQLADRARAGPHSGPLRSGPRQIVGLMTQEVLQSLGPQTPPLVHQLDSHTIYFSPSWMSKEYAARVGESLLVSVPRIAKVESIAVGLGDLGRILQEGYRPNLGAVTLAEVADVVDGTTQAFDRMLGAAYVAMSDDASRDLAATALVKAYPDSPRITIASSVISMSQVITRSAQVQILDLLNDSVRVVAYPGQAKGAERVYRMTRSVADTFLESAVGESLTGAGGDTQYAIRDTQYAIRSAANVLQAAQAQSIPLIYADARHLEALAKADISTQAKAFIVDAVQRGYGVLVPGQMVNGTIAWWQVDLQTGEMVGVGEDGTHFGTLVDFAGGLPGAIMMLQGTVRITELFLRVVMWHAATIATWNHYWQVAPSTHLGAASNLYIQALQETKEYMATVLSEYPEWLLIDRPIEMGTESQITGSGIPTYEDVIRQLLLGED